MNLDTRQRAMLKAMGVTVWQPEPLAAGLSLAEPVLPAAVVLASAQTATTAPADPAIVQTRTAPVPAPAPVAAAAAAAPPLAEPRVQAATPAPAAAAPQVRAASPVAQPHTPYVPRPAAGPGGAPGEGWRLGPALPVFPQASGNRAPDAGWLILLEPSSNPLPLSAAQQAGPQAAQTALQGDTARLLDNMLRALNLHQHPRVFSAALYRADSPPAENGSGETAMAQTETALQPALAQLLGQLMPARVLVLGLAAARAVLERQDALGRLRSEPHRIAGVPAVVTYDPAYLLRAPQAKAGAWADLCHAQALVSGL